jgi:hypothetical protein
MCWLTAAFAAAAAPVASLCRCCCCCVVRCTQHCTVGTLQQHRHYRDALHGVGGSGRKGTCAGHLLLLLLLLLRLLPRGCEAAAAAGALLYAGMCSGQYCHAAPAVASHLPFTRRQQLYIQCALLQPTVMPGCTSAGVMAGCSRSTVHKNPRCSLCVFLQGFSLPAFLANTSCRASTRA